MYQQGETKVTTDSRKYFLVLCSEEIPGSCEPKKLGVKEMPPRSRGDIVGIREGEYLITSGLNMGNGVIFFRVSEVIAGDSRTGYLDILILDNVEDYLQKHYLKLLNLCKKTTRG